MLVLLNQTDQQTFECQVGDAKGTVQKSYMKIITPLSSYSYHDPDPVPQVTEIPIQTPSGLINERSETVEWE